MAILQALISFLSRSVRKVLNSIFGWAVVALFGRSTSRQHTLLTVLVAMAALWPLLLLGIAFPRIAAFVLALVPVGEVPAWIVRTIWIGLALAVPITIGLVIARKRPPGTAGDPWLVRVARGFPITAGIAAAFTLMFVTVPVLRLVSAVRGRKDEHVVLVTTADQYDEAAGRIDDVLARHRVPARREEPRWWLTLPSTILRKLGGKALRNYLPEQMAHWRGPTLQLALYPSDLLIRGKPQVTAFAHGLIDEAFAPGPGLMTHDPDAQRMEKEIQEVWRVYLENPKAHVDSRVLLSRLRDLAKDITTLEVEYAEWQIVYRRSLQLARALEGEAQLLDGSVAPAKPRRIEVEFEDDATVTAPRPWEDTPTRSLLKRAAKLVGTLAKAELELAKTEARENVKQEVVMVKGLGLAGVCAVVAVALSSTAAVFALADTMAPWLVALLVAAGWLVIGIVFGVIGWSKRLTTPLARTRKTIEEDVTWLKNRMA